MKSKLTAEQTTREMLASLATLRLLVREVGGNYLAALQAEVARVQEAVRHVPKADKANQGQIEQIKKMLKWIRDLDVKPQKGRRRDLKELDRLIAKLSDIVDTW